MLTICFDNLLNNFDKGFNQSFFYSVNPTTKRSSQSWIFLGGETHLESVVSPAAELHDARLLVEGEVLDVHLARRVIDGRRTPLDQPRVEQGRLGGQGHLEVAVGTENNWRWTLVGQSPET